MSKNEANKGADLFNSYFEQAFSATKTTKSTPAGNQLCLTDKAYLGTVLGRPIVDEKGRPFRVITGVKEISVPDAAGEFWRVKLMGIENYTRAGVELSPEQIKLITETGALALKLSNEDDLLEKKGSGRIWCFDRSRTILMFMKLAKCTPLALSDRYREPDMSQVTLLNTVSQSFLIELESRWRLKNEMAGTDWIEKTFSRTVGKHNNLMMVRTERKTPAEGRGYKSTMDFLEASPVEITDVDLENTKDLDNEYISVRDIDMARIEKVYQLLKTEADGRSRVSQNLESQDAPEIETDVVYSTDAPKTKFDVDF